MKGPGILLLIGCTLGIGMILSCGKDRRPVVVPDATPPARVSDLTLSAASDTSLVLTWTAPGDDGDEGTASLYDIRYSLDPFPDQGHFPPAHEVQDEPKPAAAGTSQTHTIAGLRANTRYHVAMRVADEVPNWSPVSNLPSAKTLPEPPPPDRTPPASITNLSVTRTTPTTVSLSWTATGDDGTEGRAAQYDLRFGTEAITDMTWDAATSVEIPLAPAASGSSEAFTAGGFHAGESVHFALRAVDEAGNWSGVSNSPQATTTIPREWRIRANGTGDAATIQAALDMAWWGDVILVEPGRYYENLVFRGRDVVLKSVAGPEVTVLDGSSRRRPVIALNQNESRDTVIDGFTITAGHVVAPEPRDYEVGGGVVCIPASPTVINNRIINNSAFWGGGMHAGTGGPWSSPVIRNNLFQGNVASNGGGLSIVAGSTAIVEGNVFLGNTVDVGDGGGVWILLRFGSVTVINNRFYENEVNDHGGGLYIAAVGEGTTDPFHVAGNLFVRNLALGAHPGNTGSGGAVDLLFTRGEFVRNTVVFNSGKGESACSGGGVVLDGIDSTMVVEANIIAYNDGCAVTIHRTLPSARLGVNILWSNVGGDFGAMNQQLPPGWGSHVVHADPLFCDPGGDDYSVAANSPAITGEGVMGSFERPGCGARKPLMVSGWRRR